MSMYDNSCSEMTDDDIQIQRIPEAALNSALYLEALQESLARHRVEMGDEAIWLSYPHTPEETELMMEEQGFVSGYCHTTLSEINESEDLSSLLAARLSKVNLNDVLYEAVWALGDVVVIYVRSNS